ncbi:MAG: 16S rRNA (cytosine(967)-C(5))-methyltransferase RsmB [Eubacteriales bacterium]|nr:16S rRNA (cytosine(967)-C(5))-methyltransferase RsmB [Eubacteriales bacterium]MDD4583417.1 16S rRNA (cytosine(967)-C(5))-methyltransferase RsmB [Eubacteriales bacterium]
MDANRKTAYFTLMDVEGKKSYSNLALNHQVIVGRPDSVAFVRQLVYGVLENKLYLDYLIQQYVKNPVENMRNCEKTILRMGIYQIRFMESVPSYAAVNESVILAKRFCRGKEGFINGVLRNYLRTGDEIKLPNHEEDEVEYLSIKYSYAPWIVKMWLENYESSFTEELLGAGNQTPDLVIRPNLLKITRDDLWSKLEEKGYGVKEGNLISDSLHVKGQELLSDPLFKNGMFSVMDESSMMVVSMLAPLPGEFIMDVCAAPGGKTIYMAEKMGNDGKIIAQDIYRRKLNLVNQEAKRNGTTIVQVRAWDATRLDSSLEEKADRVLVDAPCSGLGVLRRKPEIKYKKYDSEMRDLPLKQLEILLTSASYVKRNGVLVYSTCTINPEENHRVVLEFLKRNPLFEKEESIQLLPNVNDTDGFYICRMKRK